jgi:hypothetical protein
LFIKAFFICLFSIALSYACSAQETSSELVQTLKGTWQWTKTEVVDRGGGGTSIPEGVNQIMVQNDKLIQFINNDSTGVEKYYINLNTYRSEIEFSFHSNSLSGRMRFIDENTFIIGNLGGCGAYYYYERVTESNRFE